MSNRKWKNIGLELDQGKTYIRSNATSKADAEKECLEWLITVLLEKHLPESHINVAVDELHSNGKAVVRLEVDNLKFDAGAWDED